MEGDDERSDWDDIVISRNHILASLVAARKALQPEVGLECGCGPTQLKVAFNCDVDYVNRSSLDTPLSFHTFFSSYDFCLSLASRQCQLHALFVCLDWDLSRHRVKAAPLILQLRLEHAPLSTMAHKKI